MAKAPRFVCPFCESPRIEVGASLCNSCGRPTQWATHEERTAWEVGQWRRTRAAANGVERTALALAEPRRREPPVTTVNSSAPTDKPAPHASSVESHAPKPPRLTFFRNLIGFLRCLFATPSMASATSTPPAVEMIEAPAPVVAETPAPVVVQAAAPVVVQAAAPIPGPVVTATSLASIPTVAAPPAPPVAPKKPPRTRPPAPTNKDMLKRALTLLTRMEMRLLELEREVQGIDNAVRNSSPSA